MGNPSSSVYDTRFKLFFVLSFIRLSLDEDDRIVRAPSGDWDCDLQTLFFRRSLRNMTSAWGIDKGLDGIQRVSKSMPFSWLWLFSMLGRTAVCFWMFLSTWILRTRALTLWIRNEIRFERFETASHFLVAPLFSEQKILLISLCCCLPHFNPFKSSE